MWYRLAEEQNKQRPLYELKVLAMDAEFAIRNLFSKQRIYNPTQLDVNRKVKKVLDHMESKYGSIANIRLYTAKDTLQDIVSENVYELFGKNNHKR